MIQIEIEKVVDEFSPMVRELTGNQVGRAVVRAMKRALVTGRKVGAQMYNEVYKLPAAKVKEYFDTVEPTDSNVPVSQIGAALIVLSTPVPLFLFRAVQLKAGVRVNLGGAPRLFRGAFIATMKSGHKGVYVRDTTKPQVKRWVRDTSKPRGGYYKTLPIRELWGISPYQFFKARSNTADLAGVVSEAFQKNLEGEVAYAVAQAEEKSKTEK